MCICVLDQCEFVSLTTECDLYPYQCAFVSLTTECDLHPAVCLRVIDKTAIVSLTQAQDRKGTPLESFPKDPSTNERPVFCSFNQSEALILAQLSVLIKSEIAFVSLTMECDLHPAVCIRVIDHY